MALKCPSSEESEGLYAFFSTTLGRVEILVTPRAQRLKKCSPGYPVECKEEGQVGRGPSGEEKRGATLEKAPGAYGRLAL